MTHKFIRAAYTLPFLALLSGCVEYGVFGVDGPVADAQRDHLISITFWVILIILPLFVGLPLIIWKYRRHRKKADYKPEWEFNLWLEIAVWGIPVIIAAILSFNLWQQTHALDPYKPLQSDEKPIEIQVVGLDWKWLFIYPDKGIASVNELVIPAGQPVTFRVTSGTVLQSFMIARLGGQIYAMPGMVTELNLQADNPGEMDGQNTQYNGNGFAQQHFTVHVVPASEYENALAEKAASATSLDEAALKDLEAQSVPDAPIWFDQVSDNAFAAIVKSRKQDKEAG